MSAPTDSKAAPAGPSSGVTPEQIQAQLKAELDATYIEIKDKSGELVLAPVLEEMGGGARLRWYVLCLSPSAASLGHNERVTCHAF
jgi:hypothetical protein